MSQSLCIAVEYIYTRKRQPGSLTWHLKLDPEKKTFSSSKIAAVESNIVQSDEDKVRIIIAVPCDKKCNVSAETFEKYENIADDMFMKIHPEADLA